MRDEVGWRSRARGPFREPDRGGARVEAPGRRRSVGAVPRGVFTIVEEDVDERAPDLGGRRKLVTMVAVAEQPTGAHRDAIHPERDLREEALHSAGELHAVVRLDEQMDVIMLDRVLEDADAASDGRGDLVGDCSVHALGSEAWRELHALDADVNGMPRIVRWSRHVGHESDALGPRLSPEPLPALRPTPFRTERQNLLSPPSGPSRAGLRTNRSRDVCTSPCLETKAARGRLAAVGR